MKLLKKYKCILIFCTILFSENLLASQTDSVRIQEYYDLVQQFKTENPNANEEVINQYFVDLLDSDGLLDSDEFLKADEYPRDIASVIEKLIDRHISDQEKKLINTSPVKSLSALLAAKKAEDFVPLYWSGSLHNTNADAFRHAVWNYFICEKEDCNWAKQWTDAHEEWPGNPPLEKQMDLHNNKLGRDIFSARRHIREVKEDIKNGKGKRIVSGRLVPTDRTGSIFEQ